MLPATSTAVASTRKRTLFPRRFSSPRAKRLSSTATHTVVLTHEMPWSATLTPLGGVWALQVEPPLVVAAISGAEPDTLPTAQQSLAFTQSMSLYCAEAPVGGV